MSQDVRGWRLALLPHALVNACPLGPQHIDVLATIEAAGYGLLQLPPAGEHGLLLAVIADQIAEYSHHGYAIVAINVEGTPGDGLHWRRLVPLLRHRGIVPPPRHLIRLEAEGVAERLADFLNGYDIAEDERRRWRG
jgi:hypothetical protein